MKLIKILVGIILLLSFGYLLKFILEMEEIEHQETFESSIPVDSNQSMDKNISQFIDTTSTESTIGSTTHIGDYKAEFQDGKLKVFTLDNLLLEQSISTKGFQYLLSSDLNTDELPEFWLFFKENKAVKVLGFQLEKAKLIPLNFPEVKGRQRIGYIGNDSLYLEKGLLVRDFKFSGDANSDFPEGFRKCFYAFGLDKSFVLKKTIDYEKR